MAKVELNEKRQQKAKEWAKRLSELEAYKSVLLKKQSSAQAEMEKAKAELDGLNQDYFMVIDEVAANQINNRRKVLKDKIEDLQMVLAMDVKGIIRNKLLTDPQLKAAQEQSRQEYLQWRDETDKVIKELEDEIDRIKDLQRTHEHLITEGTLSRIRAQNNR